MKKIEIERKFILKSLPSIKPDDILDIDQYYLKNKDNIWERARSFHSEINGQKYIHTIKKTLSKLVNLEDEHEISKEEFESFKKKCLIKGSDSRYISKERYIYHQDDLKWEVDKFKNGYTLIIAELEIPNKKYVINFPKYISDIMLLEVTGIKQFSNRNLSIKI